MYKLSIFDLDGTLLNTVGGLGYACNHIMQKHNHPTFPIEDYNLKLGGGAYKLIQRALPDEYKEHEYIQKLKEEFFVFYKDNILVETFPYEGITKVLETLQENNILIAVASNKFQAGVDELMNHFFPQINFSILMGESKDIPTKPNPTMIEKIIEHTKVDKSEIIYFGDSDVDMITGNNAGITPVGVLWGYRSKENLINSGASKTIEKVEDILSFFDL
ncbi:MAG: HAD family hydrolase [Bacteroidales bacterium]|jgi:phosphoglycolate phosphatase